MVVLFLIFIYYSSASGLSCSTQGPLCIMQDLSLQGTDSSCRERRLSSCGTRALLPRGMWELSLPASPALQSRFSTAG